jgi:hypothetical protein
MVTVGYRKGVYLWLPKALHDAFENPTRHDPRLAQDMGHRKAVQLLKQNLREAEQTAKKMLA